MTLHTPVTAGASADSAAASADPATDAFPCSPPPALFDFTPVPRDRARDDGWTADRQREFIAALAANGSVRAACRVLGMSERGAYELRLHPEAGEFRAVWDMAVAEGGTVLDDIAWDRAINGTDQVIMYKGERVAMRTHYDNRLLMFMLRARNPDVYGRAVRTSQLQKGDRQYDKLRTEWEAEKEAEAAARSEEGMKAVEEKIQNLRDRLLNNRADFRVRIMVDTPEFAEKYRAHYPVEYAAAMEIVAIEDKHDSEGYPMRPQTPADNEDPENSGNLAEDGDAGPAQDRKPQLPIPQCLPNGKPCARIPASVQIAAGIRPDASGEQCEDKPSSSPAAAFGSGAAPGPQTRSQPDAAPRGPRIWQG